jgi:hypothetical protein
MFEQVRLHLQRRVVSVLEEAVQEFEPAAASRELLEPLSFLVAKALEAAADLQALWPLYTREGSVSESGGYRRRLTLLEALAGGVVRSLRRAQELAAGYAQRTGKAIPRAGELASSLAGAAEVQDHISRTLVRLNRPWPPVNRNMIDEARAALDRGEGEDVNAIVQRLKSGKPLVKE